MGHCYYIFLYFFKPGFLKVGRILLRIYFFQVVQFVGCIMIHYSLMIFISVA